MQHVDIPWPGIESAPQQWQSQILNLLSHQGTPKDSLIIQISLCIGLFCYTVIKRANFAQMFSLDGFSEYFTSQIIPFCMAHLIIILVNFIFNFFFFWPHLWHMEVPQSGGNQSCSLDLCHGHCNTRSQPHLHASCGNAGSLTHWVRPGIELLSSQRKWQVFNLRSHNGNSISSIF